MNLDNVFELIRNEDAVLWAGAGLSMYAGYPSGNSLSEIIYSNLTDSERNTISSNLSLPELTEEFCRLKSGSRNQLIKILKENFIEKEPVTRDIHNIISLIPHFKTIVTTNYDRLFELSYGNDIHTCISDVDMSYIDENKTHLFKIHGDLSNPDSIVITNTDYREYIVKKRDSIVWSVLEERFTTKSVIFIGYNLEDQNVSILFDNVCNYLGRNRKEIFLIAPNLPKHKVSHLSRQNIEYIDLTGEEFINMLIENIKQNIVIDFEKGLVSPDTFNKFLQIRNLSPRIQGKGKNYKLNSLSPIKGLAEGKLILDLKDDKVIRKKFTDFASGKVFGKLEISEDQINDATINLEGVRLLSRDTGLGGLNFISIPNIETKIDVSFTDGFELTDIPVKIFASRKNVEVLIEYKNAVLKINPKKYNSDSVEVNLAFDHKEIYTKTKDEIEIFQLMKRIVSGEEFTAYFTENKEVKLKERFTRNEELIEYLDLFLNYFLNLKKVENYFQVKFYDIPLVEINEESSEALIYICKIIEDGYLIIDWPEKLEGEIIDDSKNVIDKLIAINRDGSLIQVISSEENLLMLHGKEIRLGYKKLEVIKPVIQNIEAIISKKETTFEVISEVKKAKVSYQIEKG